MNSSQKRCLKHQKDHVENPFKKKKPLLKSNVGQNNGLIEFLPK